MKKLLSLIMIVAGLTAYSQPTITITYPNGGEVLLVGENLNITWTSQNLTASFVKIEFYDPIFFTWVSVVDSTPNTGIYAMIVPSYQTQAGKVRISEGNNSSVFDESNAAFTITTAPVISAGNDTAICSGNSVQLTASASGGTLPYSFSWSPAASISNPNIPNPVVSPSITTTYYITVSDAFGATAVDSVTVNVNPSPSSITFNITNPSCFGVDDGIVCAIVNGGTAPYDYSWSTAAVGQCLSNISAGGYSITASDANNCYITSVVTVTQPSPIVVSLSSSSDGIYPDTVCISSVSGGVPAYTYSYGGNFNPLLNNCFELLSGTFDVTVTDANVCTATASSSCAGFQIDSFYIDNPLCYGGFGSSCVYASGGTLPYNYIWDNGEITQCAGSLIGISPSHSVTVTDGSGCADTAPVVISVPSQIQVTYTVNHVSCFGFADGSIDMTVSGGTQAYSFLWNNGSVTLDQTGLSAGSYNVTITDANGCTANQTVIVNQPTAIQASVSTIDATCGQCDGQATATVIGGVAPYAYEYLQLPLVPRCNATFCDSLCGGIQYVFVVADLNGCIDSTFFTVGQQSTLQVDSLPNNNTACNTANNGVICASISGGQQPYVYQWSNQQTTQCIDSLAAGFYTVTVTDANNCTVTGISSIASQSSLQIDSIVSTNISCYGTNDGSACVYVSNGQTPYTYLWNDNQTTQCATGLAQLSPSHSVTITDGNGCSLSALVTITEPALLTAQFVYTSDGVIPDTVTCFVNGGVPPYTINWSTGDTSVGDTVTNIYLVDGIYLPEVTDSNGCTFTDTIIIGAGCAASCMWPGDADGNGIADNNDLLPIGLAYGTTGNLRLQQDIDWYPHVSQDWADTLSTGVNYKHSDCNGNGVVNSNDTLAILQNFGQIHLKNNQRKPWRANETALYVDLTPDTTYVGDTMYANLTLGDINIPAANVYGLAFTVNYNALVVDSTKTTVTFGNSWLGTATDKISIAKDHAANGELKCAITRIDHITRSGFGQIGQVSFIITTDNINGKDLIDYYTMEVWISDLVMIDSAGSIIPANEGADSTQVEFEPSSVRNQSVSIGTLTIQPNPANNEVHLSVSYNLIGAEMKLFDIEGRMMLSKTINSTAEKLNTSAFANGMYFVQVKNEKGVLTQRLAIAR